MKKIALIFIMLVSVAFAGEINEYVSDVYFANGINTTGKSAESTKNEIETMYKFHNPTFYKSVANWKVAVNHSEGIMIDLIEAANQSISTEWWGVLSGWWSSLKNAVMSLSKKEIKQYVQDQVKDKAKERLSQILFSHEDDLETQKTAYEKSIKAGHGVIVLAHSQGNLFTVEAFDKLENWMKPYFHTLAIASPASTVPNGGPHITFDNDIITSLPQSQGANVINTKREMVWLSKTNNDTTATVPCPPKYATMENQMCYNDAAVGSDLLTINAHYISYYLSNDTTRSAILGAVDSFIDKHHKSPSQWVVKKQLGCPGRCDARLSLKHITDVGYDHLYWYKPKVVMNEPVIPFIPPEKALRGSRYGKLYKVQGEYVKTDTHYANIREVVKKNGICQITRNSHSMDKILAEFEGNPYPKSKKPRRGVVNIMLTWDMCYPDVDLDLDVKWDAGYLDVHDDKNSPFEHFVIESEDDIVPSNNPHAIYAIDKTDRSKIDPKRIAIEDPIDIAVVANAPGVAPKTFKTKIRRLDQLDLGHILDIYARKKIGPYPDNGRWIYADGVPDENHTTYTCDNSCGCIPCEYKIVGFLRMALFGPISGGAVKIFSVDEGRVVYEGLTRKSDDITEAGIINIPESKLEDFDDDGIYLIEVEGGEDIDKDDDLYVDAVPTQNKGTIHAIVTGKELKYLSFKVNILTEIAYQVSKDMLGWDKNVLKEHLDDVAKRILRRKILSTNGSYEVNYDDILVWIPSMDKKNPGFKFIVQFLIRLENMRG